MPKLLPQEEFLKIFERDRPPAVEPPLPQPQLDYPISEPKPTPFPYSYLEEEAGLPQQAYADEPSFIAPPPPVPLKDPMLMQPNIDWGSPEGETPSPAAPFSAKPNLPGFPGSAGSKLSSDIQNLRSVIEKYGAAKPDLSKINELKSKRGDLAGMAAIAKGFDQALQAMQRAYGARPADLSGQFDLAPAMLERDIQEEKEAQKELDKQAEKQINAMKQLADLSRLEKQEAREAVKFKQEFELNTLNLDNARALLTPGSPESRFIAEVAHKQNEKLDPEILGKLPAASILKMMPHLMPRANNELSMLRYDLALQNHEMQKERYEKLSQDRDENQKRTDQSQIRSYQKDLEADKVFQKLREQGLEFSNVNQLIDLARQPKPNEAAFAALGIKMAKALGERGAMTEKDVTRYVTGASSPRRVADILTKMAQGRPTKMTLNDIQDVSIAMQMAATEQFQPIYDKYANRMSRNLGISLDEAYYKLDAPLPPGLVKKVNPKWEETSPVEEKIKSIFPIEPPPAWDETEPIEE